ncbi:unnamed protein product [Urochloa decumbens]|uniref:VQ domain-containing protein n=1 Tax=Urochloa decumbens TaxID=240449 RepID=A0ABC9H9W2_9POAL
MGEHHGVMSRSSMPTRPKIKIIHIIAPEIIKTDVANFRDLVQRLTGKPAACAGTATIDTATTSPPPVQEEEEKETAKKRPAPAAPATTKTLSSDFAEQQEPTKKRKIKCEVKVEEGGFGDYFDLDRSSDLWMDLNPGGFLSFLEEEANVFQGLAAADDFLLPLGSSRMDLVGEMYAS